MGREEGGEPLSVADVAALTKMFEEHRARLLVMLQSRIDPAMGARVTAADILQEAFFLARRRWHRFAASGMTPSSWLYRLAMDSLIEVWRRENCDGRDPRREIPWPDRSSAQQALKLIDSPPPRARPSPARSCASASRTCSPSSSRSTGRCSGCATLTSSRFPTWRCS